ncbi:hypothetical protein DYB37_011280 [Aphanomyces astaci]|uniref:Cation-transporting ATPase n=1 Tax=Aphanomyces astaci TaxID=112090 RepID=A0A418FF77_APHAT|nr:hypothetical protein DYB37_011280 [Aphanomyces astaci]
MSCTELLNVHPRRGLLACDAATVNIAAMGHTERDPLIKPRDLSVIGTSMSEYVAIAGFRSSAVWSAVYVVVCLATGGVLWVITTWWPQVYTLLFQKTVHPFYLFQLISVALWLEEAYVTYALAILAMSIFSIAYEVYTQVTNANQMQALVAYIVLVQEQVVAADMVVLVGECLADESSLTGEGV